MYEPGAEQTEQQPERVQTATQPLSMEVAHISDSARDVQDSHYAITGVSHHSTTSNLQQEPPPEAAASGHRRTSIAARPELNPAITVSSPADRGAMPQNAQISSGDPKAASTSRQGHAVAASYDDGSSALAGWYGEGKGVGKMDLNRTRDATASRPIATPSGSHIVSAPIPSTQRSEDRITASNAFPSVVSHTSYSASQKPYKETLSDLRHCQPPHTSDGIARRAELAGYSGGNSYTHGMSHTYPASAAPTSSSFQVSNPSGTAPAVGQRADPTLGATASNAAQPGAFAFGVDARHSVQQLSVSTVCWAVQAILRLIAFYVQSQPAPRAYRGYQERFTVQSSPLTQPVRQPASPAAASQSPAYLNPSVMTAPSTRRYTMQPQYIPPYIDDSYTFPPRMPPAPTTSHQQETTQRTRYPSSAIENISPMSHGPTVLVSTSQPHEARRAEGPLGRGPQPQPVSYGSVPPAIGNQGVMRPEEQNSLRSGLSKRS